MPIFRRENHRIFPIINFRERGTRDRVRISRVGWPYHACQISVNRFDECCCQCQSAVNIFRASSGKWWSPWSRRSSRRWSSSALAALSLVLHRCVLFHAWDIFNRSSFSLAHCVLVVAFCSQLLFCTCYRKHGNLCLNTQNYFFRADFFSCIL